MPVQCAVYGCSNKQNKEKNIRSFTFPKNKQLRSKWIHLCMRKDKFNPDQSRMNILKIMMKIMWILGLIWQVGIKEDYSNPANNF